MNRTGNAVYARAETHTKTFWHAQTQFSVPKGDGWSEITYWQCVHDHDTLEAAESCLRRLMFALEHGRTPRYAKKIG